MNVPFIFIVFALLLPVTVAALFVCAVKLSRERRKTSVLYGISRDLEKDPMRHGGTRQASVQELCDIADGLAECRDMARQLLRRGVDDAGVLALAERLQALSEEVEQITPKHDKL